MKRFQEAITFHFRNHIVWDNREIIFTGEH
jgi:hypothetical protein